MSARSLRLLLVVLVSGIAPALADPAGPGTYDPSIGKVEVTLELPKDKPYVGEMIMLRMRSFIRADIVLDRIKQPPLINFDSQQLGRDKPIEAMVNGFNVAGFERDVAIFPQQSGRLIIDPFIRAVTIVTGDNKRVEAEFASKPIFVDVQNHEGVAPPGTWWLPAKSVTVTESWSQPPDEIKPGTLARRTITVEAVGLTADRLPPAPDMLVPGTIAFKGPAVRETKISEDGPVARATYQWDIRPISASPARMPAIHLAWFDIGERRMRDAVIPDIWVANVGTLMHTSQEKPKGWKDIYLSPPVLFAGFCGFAWALALIGLLVFQRGARLPAPVRRQVRALKRAGRRGDAAAFEAAAEGLARLAPDLWARAVAEPQIAADLAALNRARYARDGGPVPSLPSLAARIATRLRPPPRSVESPALPPLDGARGTPATSGWWATLAARFKPKTA